jgi:hypothetical protein
MKLPATSKICMSFRVIKRVSRTRRATPQPLKAHQRHKSNLQGEEEAPAIENEAPQKPKTNKQQTESHKQSLRKLSGTSCKRGLHTRKYQTPSRKNETGISPTYTYNSCESPTSRLQPHLWCQILLSFAVSLNLLSSTWTSAYRRMMPGVKMRAEI